MSDEEPPRPHSEGELVGLMAQALADAADDPARMLATVAQQTASALHAFCGFLRVSADGRWLDGITYATAPGDVLAPDLVQLLAARVPLGTDSNLARTIRERRVITIAAVTEEHLRARFTDPAELAAARRFAGQASLFVPVLRAGRAVGALSLVRRGDDQQPFTARDVAFAEQLARHAALALTTADLVAAEREQADRLQLAATLARDVAAASGDYQELLDVVVRRIGAATADACVLRFVTDDGHAFAAEGAVYHRDPEVAATLRAALQHLAPGDHSVVASQVFETGAGLVVPVVDLAALRGRSSARLGALLELLAPASLLLVPVRAAGRMSAALMLSRDAGRPPFVERDREVVEQLAAHVGIAINNARLIASTRRTAERRRALVEASTRLAASERDLAQVQHHLAEELSRQLGGVAVVELVETCGGPAPGAIVAGADASLVAEVRAARERAPGIRDVLSLPLRDGQRVLGAVNLLRTTDAPLATEDRLFAEELVENAALAIRNGALLDEVQRELTERERAQHALRTSEEQLRHAQKMDAVGRLAGGIAHDFNNLLSVVLGSCEFIEDELPPSHRSRADVQAIREAADRAARMTRQLLTFSRQGPAEREVLDLGARIVEMRPWLQRLLGERFEVVTERRGRPGLVEADPTHVEQVVMNLAINARDAMPAGGALTIETADVEVGPAVADRHPALKPGPHVMISVIDHGEGISADVLEHIFEPFFTTKPRGKGTGLGLSTVFGIVSQSGGAIEVDSAPGRGTTFRVYWPCVDGKELRPRQPVPARPATGRERILVVEDEDAVRRVLVAVLTRGGYQVIQAANGAEALTVFEARSEPIDLVLSDVVMPAMGGPQLARELRALEPRQRIVFMSGYTDDEIGREQLEALDIPLLAKPLRPDAVLRKVREALEAPAPASAG